jgi:hypothetical protein
MPRVLQKISTSPAVRRGARSAFHGRAVGDNFLGKYVMLP